MLRSGFILGVSGPAALLTLLVHPLVQETADRWGPPAPIETIGAPMPAPLPGMRPAPLAISPTQATSLPRSETRTIPAAPSRLEPLSGSKAPLKPRRMRDGCEGAISSLAGPEARRMVPGRCIA